METYNDIFMRVRKSLRAAGISESEFEARLIISCSSGRSKEEVLAMSKVYATDHAICRRIDESLERRLSGEPLAYVLGEWEFYSLPFNVNRHVLIPRIDTEVLAAEAINIANRKVLQSRVLDLCTGCGCVGIAIAANVPDSRVVLGDSSSKALVLCRENVARNKQSRRITVIEIDVLQAPQSLLGDFDIIVCNPPYIPTAMIDELDPGVRDYEPRIALDGGPDGLEYYRAIFKGWMKRLKPGGHIALECGAEQAAPVRYMMKKADMADIKTYKDTLGIERVVTGRKQ